MGMAGSVGPTGPGYGVLGADAPSAGGGFGGPGFGSPGFGSGAGNGSPLGSAVLVGGAQATVGSAGSGGAPGTATAPRKLSGRRRRETVAVLIFSGAPIFESSIPLSVFGVDRQDAGVPRYRLLVCAGEEGPLTTTGGVTLSAPFGLEALARAGTIVVPAWRSISQPPPVEAIAALRKAHHEGARIIGLCTGAFVLAAAGLLDGRPATTHWMYAPTLAKRYPRVHVDPRELFVDDGDVLTSAGTAAGIDLCLHVVRSDHGAEAANALARRLVVPNRRSGGGQAQYIDQSLPEEIGNDPLAEVVTWALENLNQQFDVEVLAARAYMSRRTFDRRFRTLTGSAPLQWLITQRVLQAQRLLETSELSVDDVARRCGFRSPVALRGHFRRQLGVSPAAYRTSYRARRPGTGPVVGVPPQGVAPERGGLTGAGQFGGAMGAGAPGQTAGIGGPATAPAGGIGQTAGTGMPGVPGMPGSAGAKARPAAQPALPAPGKNRIRPLVPPQPGPATRRGAAAPRQVEHAVAEDGLAQPGARGAAAGHRAGQPPEARAETRPGGRPGSPMRSPSGGGLPGAGAPGGPAARGAGAPSLAGGGVGGAGGAAGTGGAGGAGGLSAARRGTGLNGAPGTAGAVRPGGIPGAGNAVRARPTGPVGNSGTAAPADPSTELPPTERRRGED
jgi:transcriptional regulator GlxA family with amidase domain